MPANLDFALYFNIAFFSMLGLGMLFGFLRGLKKAMYSFVITLIFYVVFFFTIDIAVNFLWTVNIPPLGGWIRGFMHELSNITKLSQAIPILLEKFLGSNFTGIIENQHLLDFINGFALFIVKIIYTLLYFTIIQIIYRLFFFLIRIIFFGKNKKTEKYKSKNRAMGAVFGLLSGAMSVYVALIIFGGLVSISESLTEVIPTTPGVQTLSLEFPRQDANNPTRPITPLSSIVGGFDVPTQVEDAISMLNDMVTSYNTNVVVQGANQITITSSSSEENMPLNIYLFDDILSINFENSDVAIRKELSVYAGVAATVLNSDYMQTNNLSDITGDDIRDIFTQLSNSDLLTTIIPLGIEVGSSYFDTNIDIPIDDLYAIEWSTEFMQLGEVIATAFDIVNSAGILNGTTDLSTVTIDGDEVASLFDELGKSQLVTLGAYVGIAPLLESAGSVVQSIITVPSDLDWSAEFTAFGAIAGAVLNTSVSIGEIQSGDPMELIQTLSTVDFTVLLDSKLVTNAMINILSNNSNLNLDLSILEIPSDIVWTDQLDADGNITQNGELRNILLAVNALASSASNIDLANIGVSTIKGLDTTAINSIFDSRVLVATITKQVKELDLGADFPLVIPDSVYDNDGYLKKTELQNIVNAVHMAATELACGQDDTACSDIGFDIGKVLTLSGDNIDTLLSSDILTATVGKLVMDMGSDALTIPSSVVTSVNVDSVATDVISKSEIKNVFLAVSALGIKNINDIQVDATILSNLGEEDNPKVLDDAKAAKLFGSAIINATLSGYILDFTSDPSSIVVVPYFDMTGAAVRITDSNDGTEYISQAELTNMLSAILSLDITDFTKVDELNLTNLLSNSTVLLDSAILHATISKQLFDFGTAVTIPYYDQDGASLRVPIGTGDQQTIYIDKTELENTLDALTVFGDNITNFDGNIDLESILSDSSNVDKLLMSSIIQATISEQVLSLVDDAPVTIPYAADDGTEIRITVGTIVAEQTTYISKDEIKHVFDALNALGIKDPTTFEGNIDLELLSDDAVVSTILKSSIIQATISEQVLNLDQTDTLTVPYLADDGDTEIRKTVGPAGNQTEYVITDELSAILKAMKILGFLNVETFGGSVDISKLNDDDNAATVLLSSSVQATISKQVLDMDDVNGTIIVPYKDQSNNDVRITVGTGDTETKYVSKSELKEMILAINLLGEGDVTGFTGSIDITTQLSDQATIDQLLKSASIQATISEQIFPQAVSGLIQIPYKYDNGDDLRITTGPSGNETDFIDSSELNHLINSLKILGLGDVSGFTGSVNLNTLATGTNAHDALLSAIIQATVSKQLLDFDTADTIRVPYLADDGSTEIRNTITSTNGDFEYISKTELEHVIIAMNMIMDPDESVNDFTGTIDISPFFDSGNRTIMLASSIMQATISMQVLNLPPTYIGVPDNYLNEFDQITNVKISYGTSPNTSDYLTKTEINRLFISLELINITNIAGFTGTIDISALAADADQNTFLESAIMYKTVTNKLLDLGDSILIVPLYTAAGESAGNEVRTTVVADEYIVKGEIKAIINAFINMGYGNFDTTSFTGGIDANKFLDNINTVLLSSSLQATLSKKILAASDSNNLVVPNQDTSDADIRLIHSSGITYIRKTELENFVTSFKLFDLTGFTTFDSFSFTPTKIFEVDKDIFFNSYIMQATVSKYILDNAGDESALAGTTTLLVPTFDRLPITVALANSEQIEKVELINLLEGLDAMGLQNFDDGVSGSTITDLTKPDLETMVNSESLQVTMDNMLRNNSFVTDNTPNLAQTTLETIDPILTKSEIVAFIVAVKTAGTGDLTNASFDLAAIGALGPIERGIVEDSMIIRNKLTQEIAGTPAAALDPYYSYASNPQNFEPGSIPLFYSKDGLEDVLGHYGLI